MSASSKKKLRKEQNAATMTEKQQKELSEAKKLKIMTTSFIVVMALIVCAFLVTQIISGVNRNGVIEKSSVALTVGNHKLNTVQMNYYFRDAVTKDYNDAYNTYGDSATYYFLGMGLDLSKPLNKQVRNSSTGETWADYYWDKAVENAKTDYALYDLAEGDSEFKLPEDVQSTIDTNLLYLQLYASSSGASSVDEYLRYTYGQGSAQDSYLEYATVSATAAAYYNTHADTYEYDDAAIRAYEKEHYNDFSAYTFNSYYVSYTFFLPEGVTATTATTEQKNAAREKAEEVATALSTAKSVKEFDNLISALDVNKDSEEKVTSTLSTDLMHSQFKEEVANWLGSNDRKAGDMRVFPNTSKVTEDGKEVEVTNSYDIVMYGSRNDYLEPMGNVRHLLVNFEGGIKDANGNTVYSDAEKTTALTKAEGYLAFYLNGDKTEDSFVELVKKFSDDSSAADGGLFEDIHPNSNYVETFRNWATDPKREAGDTDVIDSPYGYHVMYYVGDDELTYRDYMISNTLLSNDLEAWLNELVEAVAATEGDTGRVNFGLVYTAS